MMQTLVPSLEKLVEEARLQKISLGFAESCTGGLLSAQLAALPGISDVFQGSVVSYSYQAKVDLLGVSWDLLKVEGAVSEAVALQMARGACRALRCDWSVSITGVAGPTGGLPGKPVGTVFFAAHGPHFAQASKKLFHGNRNDIQFQSAQYAVEFLWSAMIQQRSSK